MSERAPWETYGEELDVKMSPELAQQVAEYAKRNRHESTSNQAKEELARRKEQNDETAKEYQFLHPDEYADEGPRIGRIMHSSEFITKLRDDCKLKCWYREHPQPRKVTLMVQPKPGLPPEVACWVQEGFMPEFSIVRFDDHGVPLDERLRGWRTPLLQLIIKGLLTEHGAHDVFGEARGPASERYNSTLYGFRNHYVAAK